MELINPRQFESRYKLLAHHTSPSSAGNWGCEPPLVICALRSAVQCSLCFGARRFFLNLSWVNYAGVPVFWQSEAHLARPHA